MSREMKHSGIDWIGEIPKEWEIVQVKNLLDISRGRVIPITEMDDSYMYPVFSSQTKNNGCMGYINTYDYDGDALTWTTDGANAGTMFYRTGRFNCTNVCGILQLKPLKIQSSIKYLLYSIGYSAINCRRLDINGYKIMSNEMAVIQIAYPTFPEQQKIANYLDKVCGEVDEMIALQEQMIEELKAYKQSVITEAVTKGLNPNAPMRDSGIDWIGDVPEHWEIVRLKALGGLQNGISQSGDYFGEDFEFPFISYSDVYKNIEIPYPSGRANSTIEDRTRYSVLEGDVLFTRTSETIEEIGFAATCTNTIYNAVFSGFLIRFRPNSNKLFKGYSKYYFRSDIHRAYFVKEMNLVTRASLSQDLLKNLFVLIPSFSEQQSIASYLDTKCAEIDTLIAIKQAKIEELKDYKKSVIYEYVTGKKEVV